MKNESFKDEQKYTKYIHQALGSVESPILSSVTQSRDKSRHKAKGVIVHCSDSPQGRGDNAATIDRWHKERGWLGIGYHYVILEDGTIEDGRSRSRTGAHAKGYNHYVGICLIGETRFTQAQYTSLEILIKALDTENIKGHYEVSSKTCPNFDVPAFIASIEFNDYMKNIEQTEIFKEYNDKALDNEKRNKAQVENLKRWKNRESLEKQVQAKVQKESKTLLDKLKSVVCAFCR